MKYSLTIWSSLPYVILPFLCIFFDEALKISWVNKRDLVRALLDNCGHGLIAFLSWLSVAGMSKRGLTESLLCAVMASAIDLDHFVMAKSFTLKAALSLPERPPLHSTSILVPILPVLIIIVQYYPSLWTLPFVATISVVSHHIRDAHRRGMWFWPIGSTPPIPYWLYIIIIILLPLSTTLSMTAISQRQDAVRII